MPEHFESIKGIAVARQAKNKGDHVLWRAARRNLLWVFLVAQLLVLGPVTVIHFGIDDAIEGEIVTGKVINVSGRQRMLSQRIAMFANRIAHEAGMGNDIDALRDQLFDTIDSMDAGHHALAFGSSDLKFSLAKVEAVKNIYFAPPHNLNLAVQEYLDAARQVASADVAELQPDFPPLVTINTIGPGRLLQSLDAATNALEASGAAAIQNISVRENQLWLLTLVIIVAEFVFIFVPVNRIIRRQISELSGNAQIFRVIYDSSPIMLHSVDVDGNIEQVSQYWLDHLGYKRADVIGEPLTSFLTEDSARQFDDIYLPRLKREGEVVGIECQIKRGNGEIAEVVLSSHAQTDADGKFVRAFSAMIDFTEEQHLRANLQRSADALAEFHAITVKPGLTLFERAHRVLAFGNQFFGTTLGIVSRIEGSTYTIRYVMGDENSPLEGTTLDLGDSYCGNMLTSDEPVGYENVSDSPFSSHPCYDNFKLNTYMGARINVGGKPFGTLNFTAVGERASKFEATDFALMKILAQWVGTAIEQDIASRELEKARDDAEIANRTKSAFLANMSHEIRTPLNAIIGLTDLALKTPLSKIQFGYLSRVSQAGSNLLSLINDILDFSKIEAGQLQIEQIEFRLNDVLQNLASVIAPKAEEKGIEIVIWVDPALPQDFFGDPLRIGQVLINLAGNAVKFTETGAVVIRVAGGARRGDILTVRFSIQDTGIGMSIAQQEKLFTPFVQADISTSRAYGGTGLGLSISKQLVEGMHGEIRVESVPDAGSTFSFELPLNVVAREAALPRALPIDAAKTRILIVDDSEAARSVLDEALRGLGFIVEDAASGGEAVGAVEEAIAADTPFHLILVDRDMPDMSGLETVQSIRALAERVTIILMSSVQGFDELKGDVERLNINAVLTKPINTSFLIDRMMEAFADRPDREFVRIGEVGAGTRRSEVASSDGLRVLLAEDNELNQMVARGILEGAGFAIDVVGNGKLAVDQLQRHGPDHYDAVLMDIQMPVMDGLAATRVLRALPEFIDMPILAMTAHALAEEREKCREAGMSDHVTKPVDPNELITKLNFWCDPAARLGSAAGGATGSADTIKPYNVAAVSRRLMMPLARLKPLLDKFAEQFGRADTEIAALVQDGQWQEAAHLAQSVGSAAETFGADTLSEAGFALQKAIKSEDGGAVAARLPHFRDVLAETLQQMQAAA